MVQQRRLFPLAFFVGTCTTNRQGGNIPRDRPSASVTYFVASLVPIQVHGRCRMPNAWSETCSECHNITEALSYVGQLLPSVFLSPGYLQISDAQEEDKGNYECIAENSVGTAISPMATLFVRGEETTRHSLMSDWLRILRKSALFNFWHFLSFWISNTIGDCTSIDFNRPFFVFTNTGHLLPPNRPLIAPFRWVFQAC